MLARGCIAGNSGGNDAILSRNLYASFVFSVIERRPIIFETHQLELGIHKFMQRMIISRPWVTTVVISRALLQCLKAHHGLEPKRTIVLPDAAAEGVEPLKPEARRPYLMQLFPELNERWKTVCGYFGHLYPGRGIEIIDAMAAARPETLFMVFGGNEGDVTSLKKANKHENLWFLGHVSHPVARRIMGSVDILLMPYQESVSIGIAGQDTARWMSPMKMFEYLASGVPLIASDLPVLREVLENGKNCMLARADSYEAWLAALDFLAGNQMAAHQLAMQGHADYLSKFTWKQRARRLLEEFKNL